MTSIIFVILDNTLLEKQQHIVNVLQQIEQSTQDEFANLVDIGPEMYATSDLLVLKGKWEEALLTFNQLHQLVQYLGFSSPVWVLLAFPFGLMGFVRAGYFIMGLFPLSFLLFGLGSLLLKRRYNSKGYLEYIGNIINEELRQRSIAQQPSKRRRR